MKNILNLGKKSKKKARQEDKCACGKSPAWVYEDEMKILKESIDFEKFSDTFLFGEELSMRIGGDGTFVFSDFNFGGACTLQHVIYTTFADKIYICSETHDYAILPSVRPKAKKFPAEMSGELVAFYDIAWDIILTVVKTVDVEDDLSFEPVPFKDFLSEADHHIVSNFVRRIMMNFVIPSIESAKEAFTEAKEEIQADLEAEVKENKDMLSATNIVVSAGKVDEAYHADEELVNKHDEETCDVAGCLLCGDKCEPEEEEELDCDGNCDGCPDVDDCYSEGADEDISQEKIIGEDTEETEE